MPSIYKLKKLLMETPKLATVLDYFLKLSDATNIIPSSQILDSEEENQRQTLSMLIQIVENMARDFLKKEIKIIKPLMCHAADYYFYHGIFVTTEIEIPITVFYFSDLKKGLFSIARFGENTEIFRFSLGNTEEKFVVH